MTADNIEPDSTSLEPSNMRLNLIYLVLKAYEFFIYFLGNFVEEEDSISPEPEAVIFYFYFIFFTF